MFREIDFLSGFFLPTTKEDPNEASTKSHIYSLRAGLVHQLASGLYSWLPLGLKVLKNIEQIVREEMRNVGAQEILMPIVQPADLWVQSGRYDDYGAEMVRFPDRNKRELLLAPTHEEIATNIFQQKIKSYKELPQNWYHIQWKFRDEIRPRFGVMRSREFLMKDAYSFDLNQEKAMITYDKMYLAYYKAFTRMGLRCVPAHTQDTGPIGGSLSHEFHIVTPTGENKIFYDARFDTLSPEQLTQILQTEKIYGALDNSHQPKEGEQYQEAQSIEVGHIFYFGPKYSKAMSAQVVDEKGQLQYVHMGSYGIGISRLVGAIIESCHDEKGIIWPKTLAPYDIGIIDLLYKEDVRNTLCTTLENAGIKTLYDDTKDSAGVKFTKMDLIGLPWQIVLGKTWQVNSKVELKNRQNGQSMELEIHQIPQAINP